MIIRINHQKTCENCKYYERDVRGEEICKSSKKGKPPNLCYYWQAKDTPAKN